MYAGEQKNAAQLRAEYSEEIIQFCRDKFVNRDGSRQEIIDWCLSRFGKAPTPIDLNSMSDRFGWKEARATPSAIITKVDNYKTADGRERLYRAAASVTVQFGKKFNKLGMTHDKIAERIALMIQSDDDKAAGLNDGEWMLVDHESA